MRVRLRAGGARLARQAELLIFPSFCRLCSRPLGRPSERVVCDDCLAGLSPRHGPVCLCCGRFFDGAGGDHLCARCLERVPPYTVQRSCGRYDGVLKDLILLFKYGRVSALRRPLARFAAAALSEEEGLWLGADLLVPVPLHPERKRERGFNQSQLLARELARIRGMRVLEGCLVKVRNVPPQTSLEAAGRETNVRGAFAVRRRRRVEGKVVVLVDDVFTTGSTLDECGRVLKRAGAREVRALTLAQA
ncbi:MAG TPA: ComF family protein [Burkholderiales bacterium]|nr:ComF family protein [Burkholderiales bacterium]